MISIEVNEKKLDVNEGSTLKDAIEQSSAYYIPGTTIGILKAGTTKEEATPEYKIFTSKGEFSIELKGDLSLWNKYSPGFTNVKAHWETNNSIAFGPFETDVSPQRIEQKFNRYDVFLGTGGYDAKNTYLMFSKNRHVSDYGCPANCVVGMVISGKQTLTKLRQGDTILKIEPVIKWETLVDKLTTDDLNTKLEDGMKIFTYFNVDLFDEAPEGAEHFLGLIRRNVFNVDAFTNSFIADDSLHGETCPYEHWEARSEGSVVVRTAGAGFGRTFIYKEDRTSSAVHSVIGLVSKGIELVKIAEKGSKIALTSNPKRILLIGMGFDEAEKLLGERGIRLEKKGYTGDDAVIVEQQPDTTIEMIKGGVVNGTGVKSDHIINVEFYDGLAPKTLDFLRHSLRLKDRPLGPLPVFFTYENTFLFRTQKGAESYKEIIPENTPKTKVLAGDIGVTNQAAKRYGMVGVRLVDDDKYGPSGEKFECTNIIGKVLEPERLRDVKEGDTIYIREVS
ncbi:MAG: methanogenesis marker 3 protein [Candidatus Methanoperedens sp.]